MIFGLAPMAQLVEQLTLNQWVPGSSPGGCTNKINSLAGRSAAANGIANQEVSNVRQPLFAF